MIAIKKIYKVSEGDTLWGIAKKYLGRVSRYTEIVRLNKLQTAYLIEGQLLRKHILERAKRIRISYNLLSF